MAKPTGARDTAPYGLRERTSALRIAVEAYHHALRIHDTAQYGAADRRRRAAALAEEHGRLTDQRDQLRREWAALRG